MRFPFRQAWTVRRGALLCLFLYNAAVFIGGYIADVSIQWRSWIIPVLLLGAAGFTILLDRLCQYALKKKFEYSVSGKERWYTFLLTFAVIFGILAMYYYAFFPGAFSPDANAQLSEAVHRDYSDWHPFIQTFLFYTVPLRIFGAVEMIIFLQILWFSLSFSYLMMTVRGYGCPRWLCAASVLLMGLSPVTGHIMMDPIKDCGMAIFSTVATAHYIHIVMTKGQWLERKKNLALCSIFWALTALVRHNAPLFVLPVIAVVAWIGWARKTQVIAAVFLFLALLFLIKVPFYRAYDVEKPGSRVVESVGMCMTIMGNVAKNCPASLDGDVLEFLYRVAPKEVWEELYTGEFNNIKWHEKTNVGVIEEAGFGNILKYTLKAFKASPMYSLQAFSRLTGMVWKVDGDATWRIVTFADTVKTEITLNAARQAKVASSLADWKEFVSKGILRYPTNYLGLFHLAIIAFSLSAIRTRRDIWKVLIGVPLLCYSFGTALLLTGFDWRFFYMVFPVAIPMIFLVIKKAQGGETQ